jgi:NAD(P)H-quinone oxidoreductase subunit 5
LRTAVVAGAVVVGGFAAATATGTTITASPGPFTLVAVLVLGLAVLMANAADRGPLLPMVGRAALAAGLVTVTYVVLQAGAVALTAGTLPAPAALGSGLDLVMVALVVLGFAVTAIIQLTLPFRPESQRWQAWHAHVANGFYVNTIANRLVIGLWPVPVPASAANTPR